MLIEAAAWLKNIQGEKLNSLDKKTIIQLFLSQQENIDCTLQLVLEKMADLKRHRFGRSSERYEAEGSCED